VSRSQTPCQVPVEREVQVYLETNVLRYFDDAISDPRPPGERAEDAATAACQIGATRLFLYASARGWRLWISGTARSELQKRDQQLGRDDWTVALYEDLDERSDAPPAELVRATAERYRLLFKLGAKHRQDMRHLARVLLLPWIDVFVTNDDGLAKRTRRALTLASPSRMVRILSPPEAEQALDLQRGEEPPLRPAPTHPLYAAPQRWWIPGTDDPEPQSMPPTPQVPAP
jgi:hypothetical protein